jgi:hypothetical protein
LEDSPHYFSETQTFDNIRSTKIFKPGQQTPIDFKLGDPPDEEKYAEGCDPELLEANPNLLRDYQYGKTYGTEEVLCFTERRVYYCTGADYSIYALLFEVMRMVNT